MTGTHWQTGISWSYCPDSPLSQNVHDNAMLCCTITPEAPPPSTPAAHSRMKVRMSRIALAFLLVFLLSLGLVAGRAQAQPAAATQPATPAKPAAATASLNAAQARDALDALQDPKKRAQLINVLDAIAKTGVVPAAPAPPPPPPAAAEPSLAIPLAPDSLGAQLLVGVPDRLAQLSEQLTQTFDAATDFPLLWLWLYQLSSDPTVHQLLYDVGWRLAVVMGVALIAEFLLRRALRRPIAALASRAPALPEPPPAHPTAGLAAAEAGELEAQDLPPPAARRPHFMRRMLHPLRRLPYALAAEVLDLLPLLAILGLSNGILNIAIDASAVTTLVIQAVINGYITWRIAIGGVRLLLAPTAPRLRLLPMGDIPAAHLLLWAQRIVAIGIAGGAVAEVGVFFGLYRLAHDALVKLVWFVVVLCLATVVLQYRAAVAHWLRPRRYHADETASLLTQARARLAPVWHYIVILGLFSVWLVSALEIAGGYRWLLKAFLSTATILVLAQILTRFAVTRLRTALRETVQQAEGVTALATRLLAYEPLMRLLVRAAFAVLTAIALAEAWGIPAFSWFGQGRLGNRLLASLGSIGLTLAIALAIWEAVNAAIERHQARLSASEQAVRSARLRTLLPMLRTTLLITIVTIVILIVLSEIGVNIAPLLAGAGVIGLAIGFGSQKLVQDIITGLFLLLENAMQVGDVVTLGGMTGTVENLSIRTIRLRSVDGSVHIVPFSAVTSVTNMSRDFGFAVVDVSVGLNEESDRIATLLRELAAEMRAEDAWRGAVLADLEVLGVEKFLANAWVMRVRVRTTPGQRWAVGRELNRRIKHRFDELKIESPMTSYRALGIATPHPDALMAALSQTYGGEPSA